MNEVKNIKESEDLNTLRISPTLMQILTKLPFVLPVFFTSVLPALGVDIYDINSNIKTQVDPVVVHLCGFSEGKSIALLRSREAAYKLGCIDSNMRVFEAVPGIEQIAHFSEGFCRIKYSGKWVFLNSNFVLVNDAGFEDAHDYKNGFAAVKLNGRWGYIDRTGKLCIPNKFMEVSDFSNGLAAVCANGKIGFINESGKMTITPAYKWATKFSEDKAIVSLSKRENDFFCIDKKGKRIFTLSSNLSILGIESSQEFTEPFDLASSRGSHEVVCCITDKPRTYQSGALFSSSLLCLRKNREVQYINNIGKPAFSRSYSSGGPFLGELAIVSKNVSLHDEPLKLVCINKRGERLLGPAEYLSMVGNNKVVEQKTAKGPVEIVAPLSKRHVHLQASIPMKASGGILVSPYSSESLRLIFETKSFLSKPRIEQPLQKGSTFFHPLP